MKCFKRLDEYMEAALATARYERIDGGTRVYGEVPSFRGVWADGTIRGEVREELRRVLRGWIDLQMERSGRLPPVNGVHAPERGLTGRGLRHWPIPGAKGV